ncbi:MAG: aldose epimerase family protein [Ignavibacteria bacterium]
MKKTLLFLSVFIFAVILILDLQGKGKEMMGGKELFGKLSDGTNVYLFTLKNSTGAKVTVTNFGATVVSLIMPDRNGKMDDIVFGYDSLDGYIKDNSYFGTIVGRYGNRIANGKFTLEGKQYQISLNDGENMLHGGRVGFNKHVYDARFSKSAKGESVRMTYISKDGEEGFPGNLSLTVTYTLTSRNELKIEYFATTDKITVLNLTHHSYFNLSGNPESTILDNEVSIDADKFTQTGKGLIPTGIFQDVENTPLDLRKPVAVGAGINKDFEQLVLGHGYDHNWVINNYNGKVRKAATVYDAKSGRFMEVLTDQPGMQFYTGNFLDGKGKNNITYRSRTALCLEAQHFPDSPNKPQFPSVTLKPGETYRQTTIYKFSVK